MKCYRCGRPFNPDQFTRDTSKSSGFKSICKPCDSAKGRAYYAANRERVLQRAKARQRRRRAA